MKRRLSPQPSRPICGIVMKFRLVAESSYSMFNRARTDYALDQDMTDRHQCNTSKFGCRLTSGSDITVCAIQFYLGRGHAGSHLGMYASRLVKKADASIIRLSMQMQACIIVRTAAELH